MARSPERYSVRVRDKEYSVGADGKVLIEFPATRRACSVYLFDRIPISRGPDPLKAKSISVLIAGNAVRTLSMDELSKLPFDGSGDHLLSFAGRH